MLDLCRIRARCSRIFGAALLSFALAAVCPEGAIGQQAPPIPPEPKYPPGQERVDPFAAFDVGVATVSDGRRGRWTPLAQSQVKLRIRRVYGSGEQTLPSMMRSRGTKISIDANALRLLLLLNPGLPDDARPAAGQVALIFDAADGVGPNDRVAVQPFQRVWADVQDKYAALQRTINTAPADQAARTALQNFDRQLQSVLWRDPDAYLQAGQELGRLLSTNLPATLGKPEGSAALNQALQRVQELSKSAKAGGNGRIPLFVLVDPKKLPQGQATSGCWIEWGPPGAPVSVPFPQAAEILTMPSNLVIWIENETEVLTSEKDGLVKRSDFDYRAKIDVPMTLGKPCK